MKLLIVLLAVLFVLGALLGGVGALPFLLIGGIVVVGVYILVRAYRGERIAPR